jgi:hypothetical protein
LDAASQELDAQQKVKMELPIPSQGAPRQQQPKPNSGLADHLQQRNKLLLTEYQEPTPNSGLADHLQQRNKLKLTEYPMAAPEPKCAQIDIAELREHSVDWLLIAQIGTEQPEKFLTISASRELLTPT